MKWNRLENVHVFNVGKITDSEGNEDFYTATDLQEMAANYDPTGKHEAPIVIGHIGDKNKGFLRRDDTLANGWVVGLSYNEGKLYADLDVDDATLEMMEDGRLKKRSLGFYSKNSKASPVKGQFYIRHLALLGAAPPAVKGLKDIQFYNEGDKQMEREETIAALNENAAEWLAFILKDEGNGFGENIVEIMPEPSEENNWLYDEEEGKFAGKLMDDRDNVYEFAIIKEGDGWSSSVKMIEESEETAAMQDDGDSESVVEEIAEDAAEEAAASSDAIDVEDVAEEAAEEEVEMKEEVITTEGPVLEKLEEPVEKTIEDVVDFKDDSYVKAMEKELKELREAMKKYEEEKEMKAYSEISTFCDGLYASSQLTDNTMKKEYLVELLKALFKGVKSEVMIYSEGDKQVNAFEGVKTLLANLPEQVNMSENLTALRVNEPVVKEDPNSSKESNKLHASIMKYMEEKGMDKTPYNYRMARRAVYK